MALDVQMECFFSLAETLNFSETAKQLYISQQAVSKNISRLEEKIGFPLFYRSPHNVQITPWGKQYLELNRQYLKNCRLLLDDYHHANNTFKILTLNQPDFEPVKRMHPFQIPDTEYFANVELFYDTPALGIQRLLDRDVDMLVTIDRFVQDRRGLVIKPIFRLEAALLVSKNHPRYHIGVNYLEFKNEAFVAGVPSSDFFETRDSIMRDIESFGLNPSSIIIVSNTVKALETVARGEGIILGSVMSRAPYESSIATVPTGVENHIVCVWNDNLRKSYSDAFADFLAHEFLMAEKDRRGELL